MSIQTTLPGCRSGNDSPEQRFVRAVLGRYLWLPETPIKASRYDRLLASSLWDQGVALLDVEAALLLVSTRRVLREPWRVRLAPIRSLSYFAPAIAEAAASSRPPDIDDLVCLLRRLRPLAEDKRARLSRGAQP